MTCNKTRGACQKILCFALCTMLSAFCTGVAWGASCLVTTTPANFGHYDPIGALPSDAVAVITVNCTAGITYNITSDAGQNFAAGFQRRMINSGTFLNYNLYIDPALTELLGDGTGTTFTLSGTGTGAPAQNTIYGRIPGGQRVRAGIYRDLVIVTVAW